MFKRRLNGSLKGIKNEVNNIQFDDVINEKLLNHSFDYLKKGVDSVFREPKYGTRYYEMNNSLERNVFEFATYKSAQFTEKLKNRTPEEVDAIIKSYNNQLTVERNLATRSSRSAKQWAEIERTKDIYPNIEYLPSRSADKRSEHIKLYGTILPVDHHFWDTHFPPNAYNCKCRTGKSDAKPTGESTETVSIPKGVAGNSGKSGKVFDDSHPFFTTISEAGKRRINREMEKQKLSIPYKKTSDFKKKKSSVTVHLYADRSDLDQNFQTAKTLASNVDGIDVKIRPHVENVKTDIGKNKRSNPEYMINGKHADLKLINSKNINNRFKAAKNQGCDIVVFEIKSELSIKSALDMIKGQINVRKSNPFKRIFVVKGNEVVEFKK